MELSPCHSTNVMHTANLGIIQQRRPTAALLDQVTYGTTWIKLCAAALGGSHHDR